MRRLGVLDDDVEVTVVVKDAGVEEFKFRAPVGLGGGFL